MPWSGATFSRTNGTNTGASAWQNDRDAGTNIVADRHDTHDQDLADGINACLKKDGGNSATADIPMGSNKLTGLANGAASDDSAAFGQIASGINTSSLFRGYIDGLILSNNATDSDHDIDIAAGVAKDGGNSQFLSLTSALVKQIDASWAVGTNQGGLDGTESVAGTPDASTWYHVWLIKRSDTGVVDALFSESATSPTMPTNYDLKRRIGAVLTDATPDILAFKQVGDEFRWDVPARDFLSSNPGTSAVLQELRVPLGVKVRARTSYRLSDISAAGATACLITDPDQADTTPTTTGVATLLQDVVAGSNRGSETVVYDVTTDTSSQVRVRLSASDADIAIEGTTHSWEDPRGRDA